MKLGGICWVINSVGLESGNGCSMWWIVLVLFVEVLIVISFLEFNNGFVFSVVGVDNGLCAVRFVFAVVCIFLVIILLYVSIFLWIFSCGLVIKFIVFSFSVCSVIFDFLLVREEIIIMGIGCKCINFLRKFSLFICGILIFSVSILGLNFLIKLCVISGLGVVVIIFMLLWLLMIFVMIWCISVELLIDNILILFIVNFYLVYILFDYAVWSGV